MIKRNSPYYLTSTDEERRDKMMVWDSDSDRRYFWAAFAKGPGHLEAFGPAGWKKVVDKLHFVPKKNFLP